MEKTKNYPYWDFKSEREWKREARKRWIAFMKAYKTVRTGCAYYPDEPYNFLRSVDFENADKAMKEYYKKA